MANYLTFYFDAKSFEDMLTKQPNYFLINVGFKLIDDPDNEGKQVAVLVTNAEAYKNGDTTIIDSAVGCPVPPCRPGTGGLDPNCITEAQSLLENYKSKGDLNIF